MPHLPPLTCTTTASASLPKTQPPSPPPSAKRRGNPDLHLSPRCGARTRAGCPCRAPAIHGKRRCRMHGGRSTGPRTEEGRARLAAAHTTHGGYDAAHRAFNRHHVSFLRRSPVRMFAVIHRDRLPPELAARMNPLAPELVFPPRPTRGITRAEDCALLQAETEALAPWKQAIALAREARRADRAARAAPAATGAPAQARPLAPGRADVVVASASAPAPSAPAAVPSGSAAAQPKPHAPIPPDPAQPGPHLARAGGCAAALAKPHATEPASHGARHVPTPAGAPAQPKAHAPIAAGAAQPELEPATAGACVAMLAKPHATEPASHGARHAPTPAGAPAPATVHAPIPVAAAQPGSESAPASARAEAAAKPHAPDRHRAHHTGPQRGAAAPIASHAAKPHAPVTAATRPRTDTAGIRRAAALWRSEQRRLKQS